MNKKTLQKGAFGLFLILFLIFTFVLNLSLDFEKPADTKDGAQYREAQVTRVISDTSAPDPDYAGMEIGVQKLELRLLAGERKGELITTNNFVTRTENNPAKVGTKMLLASYDNFVTSTVESYSRGNLIYIMGALFVGLVLVLGRVKGLRSVISLGFTLVCVVFLFIPLIIKGVPPVPASMLVVILSATVMLIFITGFTKKTLVSCISCISCTCLAGIVAFIFARLANVSSLNSPEAEDLIFIATNNPLKIKDLMFAAILIASLGAILDTTMSIASALYEMKEINPGISQAQLLKSGMNVGKDTMGTMVNTLILAFVGSSLNLFVIYYMYNLQYIQLINLDFLLMEAIQSLSGSIAVVLSIPVSAFLSARFFTSSSLFKKPWKKEL